MRRSENYDAIVVGAGHNGLICAGYLAKGGLRTLVLERREVVGGAAVTEEIAPGFLVSTASYSLSLFRPDIYRDFGLAERGVRIVPKDPQMFVPLLGGGHFFIWRDAARTVEELRRIHPRDADNYQSWNTFWDKATSVLRPLIDDPEPPSPAELETTLNRRGLGEVWRLAVAGSVAETVSAFFEHDAVKGAFASQGIIGTNTSPHDPGTSWVMAYHYLGGELCGANGTWANVMGGMGAVTEALRRSAEAFGAEIRTGIEVEEILIEGEHAAGVRAGDGGEFRAPVVVSNADPHRTFERLLPPDAAPAELTQRVASWRMDGCVAKVNLALSELPDFTAHPGASPGPQHSGTVEISPSLEYLHAAHEDAERGNFSAAPFMEAYLQSAVDPSVAEKGHVLSAFTQFAPRDWSSQKKERALQTVIATLASYAPNIKDAVVAAEILGPPELEERFGLTGGDIFHGSILPGQCFGARFDYRTPVGGLYLCGSGARPGGGVMGAAGRNAARTILADSEKG